ncbi:MAG: murein biosynthesis integral membrane protein MurJ [Phycisphaerae bacterium]|nr:murein biosynthesis integral membrane protein MurJ [Phycisphaerae bacterium]
MQRAADSNSSTTPASPPLPAAARSHFVSATRVFTALTFVSRIFGLVRETVMARAFGRTGLMDAFSMGFRVPNLFRRLFGEGALTSAMIPVLTEYESSPDPEKRKLGLYLVQAVVTLTGCLLAVITIAVELFILCALRTPAESPSVRLMQVLTAIMMPYVIMICLVGLGSAVLNVRGRFAEQASAPIILNLCNILTAAVIAPLFTHDPRKQIFFLAFSVLIAGVLQLAMIVRALAKRGFPLRVRFDFRHEGVRRVMWLTLPMIVPLAVVQINTYMDNVVAWWLTIRPNEPTAYHVFGLTIRRLLTEGGVASLNWAALLYEMPLGVFSVAVATAIFPALARHGAARDYRGLADTLRRGLQISLLIAIPATAGLCLLRLEMVSVILQYGKFTASDSPIVAETMMCFAIGLAAFSVQQMLVRAFYSLKQVRTPVWIAVSMVALNFPLNIALVQWIGRPTPAGMALSTTICAFIQATWLGVVLRRQLGLMGGRRILRSLASTLAATAVMCGVIILWQWLAGRLFGQNSGPVLVRVVRLLVPIIAGAMTFYVIARLLRNEALRELTAREG